MSEKKNVASKEEFLGAVDTPFIEEFVIKSIGKVVHIAPANLVDTHRILAELTEIRANPSDADARAAWDAAWVVACMVEPKITAKDARKLIDSRNPDVRRLALRCQAISTFGILDESEAQAEATEIDTAEEMPGTAPLE